VALPVVILLWWCIVRNEDILTTLLVAFATLVIFIAVVIGIFVYLFMRRVRAALSTLAAAAIIAGGFAARGTVLDAARYADFAIHHRADYERVVEMWRAKNPGSGPLRLVLDLTDVSTFVVPTVFDYIVYDETDAIDRDPVLSGYWPCATEGCGNGLTYVSGQTFVVKSFGDHFYFVEQVL
jgi:hypothetical protein